jgi:mono/diheme cytochrome c family protein
MKVVDRIALSCFFALTLASAAPAADTDQVALAQKAQAVLKAHCYRCHGQEGAN